MSLGSQISKYNTMKAPGLLATAITGATVGYSYGDKDTNSMIYGGMGAIATGYATSAAAGSVYNALRDYRRQILGPSTKIAETKFIDKGMSLTKASRRGMLFAAGAMLGGAYFSRLFGSSQQKNYKQGFNSQRGNSISR